MLGRREMLCGASAAAVTACRPGAAPEDPGGPSRRGTTPSPFVCGLSFMPEDTSLFSRAGLSGMIADVTDGEMRTREDGVQQYYRSYAKCRERIEAVRTQLDAAPECFLATRGPEIETAHADGRAAVFFQFQGAEPLEPDVEYLDEFHSLGLRILQLTHNLDNRFAGAYMEPRVHGLTDAGVDLVERAETRRILVDLSHASEPTALQTLARAKRPVVLTHGGARALLDHPRCTTDEVLRGIGESGGVAGVFMMSFWLTPAETPSVKHFIDQLRHIENVAGAEAVGLANDFPIEGHTGAQSVGNENAKTAAMYSPWWKQQQTRGIPGFERFPKHAVFPELNDERRLFTIHEALRDAGIPSAQVDRIMGANWTRVLSEAL